MKYLRVFLFSLISCFTVFHSQDLKSMHRYAGPGHKWIQSFSIFKTQKPRRFVFKIQLKKRIQVKQISLDPIELQIAASRLQSGQSLHPRLDAASSAVVRMMHRFTPQPTTREQWLQYMQKQRYEQYLNWKENPQNFMHNQYESSLRDFQTDYYEEEILESEDIDVLNPGFILKLFHSNGSREVTVESVDPSHIQVSDKVSKTQNHIQRLRMHRRPKELSFEVSLAFEPHSYCLGIVDDEGVLLDYPDEEREFSFRGPWLLLRSIEILPRIKLKGKS